MIKHFLKWYVVDLPVSAVIKPNTVVYLRDDVVCWLNENCSAVWSQGKVISLISCDVWFENEEDAFAYMLKWG